MKFCGIERLFGTLQKHDAGIIKFIRAFTEYQSGRESYLELLEDVDALFIKPKKVLKIEVSADKVEEYRNLFPEIKLPSEKYARNNVKELTAAFQKFFKAFPEYNDWDLVLSAAQRYVDEYERKNWMYMRTSRYFISKQRSDRSVEYELANYCQMTIECTLETPANYFNEKIV